MFCLATFSIDGIPSIFNSVVAKELKLILSLHWIDITIPHNVSKSNTNRRIRNLLKTYFLKIKHIKMKRIIHPFFVSLEHSTKQLQGIAGYMLNYLSH